MRLFIVGPSEGIRGRVPYAFKPIIATSGVIYKDIRQLHASGKTFRRIARVLTERNIPTKSRRSSTWQGKTVQMFLARTASLMERVCERTAGRSTPWRLPVALGSARSAPKRKRLGFPPEGMCSRRRKALDNRRGPSHRTPRSRPLRCHRTSAECNRYGKHRAVNPSWIIRRRIPHLVR